MRSDPATVPCNPTLGSQLSAPFGHCYVPVHRMPVDEATLNPAPVITCVRMPADPPITRRKGTRRCPMKRSLPLRGQCKTAPVGDVY